MKEGEEGKYQLAVPLIYAFIDCFLYMPWSETEAATLVYWDALTN